MVHIFRLVCWKSLFWLMIHRTVYLYIYLLLKYLDDVAIQNEPLHMSGLNTSLRFHSLLPGVHNIFIVCTMPQTSGGKYIVYLEGINSTFTEYL
jgi:hypothetical protein